MFQTRCVLFSATDIYVRIMAEVSAVVFSSVLIRWIRHLHQLVSLLVENAIVIFCVLNSFFPYFLSLFIGWLWEGKKYSERLAKYSETPSREEV